MEVVRSEAKHVSGGANGTKCCEVGDCSSVVEIRGSLSSIVGDLVAVPFGMSAHGVSELVGVWAWPPRFAI